MSKKKVPPTNQSEQDDYRIIDTGVERRPRMPAVPPSVAGTSTAAGAWGGGGDDGDDFDIGTGTSVGIGTGTSVGIGTGTSVGIGVGTSVGIGVGTSVGIGVGTSVGVGVGTSVGIGTGTSVGIGTGTSVGIGTGTSVGVSANLGSGSDLGDSGFIDPAGGAASLRQAMVLARHHEALREKPVTSSDKPCRLVARDLWRTVRPAQPAISPCGKWVAFVKLERITGGALQHERIFLQRISDVVQEKEENAPNSQTPSEREGTEFNNGAAPTQESPEPYRGTSGEQNKSRPNGAVSSKHYESGSPDSTDAKNSARKLIPLTDATILADTPVWKPAVFGDVASRAHENDGRTQILFRARATPADILQLYIVDVRLPRDDQHDGVVEIGRSRRLTNVPTHPWAPKWRRFETDAGMQNRIYFVAATPELNPNGYDHLVFDDALVGWWNNLRLPHRKWRFYEVDVAAPSQPKDLLGPHQPLLDFVNGVWGCWDVHPGGGEIVWSAVNQQGTGRAQGRRAVWPNDVTLDLWWLPINDDYVQHSPTRLTPPENESRRSGDGDEQQRGKHDDYMPMFAPSGEYLVYAEKQFSTLPADYPKIVRLNTRDCYCAAEKPADGLNRPISDRDVFDIIKERSGPKSGSGADTLLPVAWQFAGKFHNKDHLLVAFENLGKLELKLLPVPDEKPTEINLPIEHYGDSHEGFSAHDFDVKVLSHNYDPLRVCAVVSAITEPPELALFKGGLPSESAYKPTTDQLEKRHFGIITNFNSPLRSETHSLQTRSKLLVIGGKDTHAAETQAVQQRFDQKAKRHESQEAHHSRIYGPESSRFQLITVYPAEIAPHLRDDGTYDRTAAGGKKYPLVQLVHGGPNSSWLDEFHMRFNASLLASNGYVVAMVNFRGSTGGTGGESSAQSILGAAPTASRGNMPAFLKELRKARHPSEVHSLVSNAVKRAENDDLEKFLKGLPSRLEKQLKDPNISEEDIIAEALEAAHDKFGHGKPPLPVEEHRAPIEDRTALIIALNSRHFLRRDLRKMLRSIGKKPCERLLSIMDERTHERLLQRKGQGDGGQRWDRGPLEDLQYATEYLVDVIKVADEDRIAMIGASYGAYLGARTLGWKKRRYTYRAAVLHAGVYEPLSQFASDAFWVQYDNFGDKPWIRERVGYSISREFDDGEPEHWRRFSRISPLLRSHRLVEDRGKPPRPAVLVTHGLNDLRVPWQQSTLLHRMLLDRGVKSRLVLYPGLGHRLDQPEPSVQWWSAALAWLSENGVEPGSR